MSGFKSLAICFDLYDPNTLVINNRMRTKYMDSRIEDKLKSVTDRIVKAFDPNRIIMFGSRAYGQPTPDSDLVVQQRSIDG